MLLIKYLFSDFQFESRDKREMTVARDLGFDVLVCDYGESPGLLTVEGFQVERQVRRLSAIASLRKIQVFLDLLFVQPYRLRRKGADVISGHDLLALGVAWMSTLFLPKKRRPQLVYDAHEYTIGLANGWRRRVVTVVERFLIRRSAFSIMVNAPIAERVQQIHRLNDCPVVARSMPMLWTLSEDDRVKRREELCSSLGMSSESYILMYHGAVIPHRGIEMTLRVLVGRSEVALVVLGNGSAEYIARLRDAAKQLGVFDRVLFHDAVSVAELSEYVGAADVGMVTVPAVSDSYFWMLPNKFFENVQSLTPVIASDFPVIGSLVNQYDIGILVDPQDLVEVGNAVDRLRSDARLSARIQANLLVAKADLCWEKEKGQLVTAYSTLLS